MTARIIRAAALLLLLALSQTVAAQAPTKQLTAAYNASGLDIYRRLAEKPGNIVMSPLSIGTAMAMALAGARGTTEAEMLRVLKHTLARPQIDAANGALMQQLNGYDKGAAPPDCGEDMRWTGHRCESTPAVDGSCPALAERAGQRCVRDPFALTPSARLAIANALMLVRDNEISTDYAALVRNQYAAEVFARAGLDDINQWVSRKTDGRIPQILDRLDADAVAVLLNAVYFKAHWQAVFAKSATTDAPFSLTPSRRVDLPMMQQDAHFSLAARQGYRAIRLPYDVPALAMIVVLPDAVDGLADVERRCDGDELSAVSAAFAAPASQKYLALALPRFKTSFKADLKAVFQQAGLRDPFGDSADFSGMTGRPAAERRLKISDIVHRAVIDVMEEGTEAAAATAIGIAAASLPPKPEPFRVDHPFLFFIVDRASGAVLFQGRIMDPRE